jgi:glycosyltransferase involved in cell wall biosynthesis
LCQLLTEIDTSIYALYNQAAAFVYPSRYEGFGIPLLEAMCCACPIVASHIPTSIEIGATFPFYFELDNDEALREALDNAINTPKNAPHILQAIGYAQRFSWDKTAQNTLDLYHQLD